MDVLVRIYVENVDDLLDEDRFESLRLFRDTHPQGDFATPVTTIPLVAGQFYYEIGDEDGDEESWYRYDLLHDTSGDISPPSPPFRPRGTTLRRMRRLAAQRSGTGFWSRCTEEGTVSALRDAVLRDQGVDPSFLDGAWVFRPNADALDRIRRLQGQAFNAATGDLVPVREWGTVPENGEPYEVYTLIPPTRQPGFAFSWDDAVRDGLRMVWYTDQVIAGVADGTASEFRLEELPALDKRHVRRVLLRHIDSLGRAVDIDASKQGRFWTIRENGPDERMLVLSTIPRAEMQVVVEVARRPHLVWRDDDYVEIDENLAVAATVLAAYEYLNRIPSLHGQYEREVAGAATDFRRLYAPYRVDDALVGV